MDLHLHHDPASGVILSKGRMSCASNTNLDKDSDTQTKLLDNDESSSHLFGGKLLAPSLDHGLDSTLIKEKAVNGLVPPNQACINPLSLSGLDKASHEI